MKDERIDKYIGKSVEFAQPILEHLRNIVRETVPDVHETMKWSFPHFEYKKSILCSMASFKQHCSFGFWLGSLMEDTDGIFKSREEGGMGHFGKITCFEDLPSDEVIKRYIHQALVLIDSGAKQEKKPITKLVELKVPEELQTELDKHPKAMATFEKFSPSQRKEYIEWVSEAKTEATKIKRLETTIEWLTEGKIRHWKYVRK